MVRSLGMEYELDYDWIKKRMLTWALNELQMVDSSGNQFWMLVLVLIQSLLFFVRKKILSRWISAAIKYVQNH